MQAIAFIKSEEEKITFINTYKNPVNLNLMSRHWKEEKITPKAQNTWEEVGADF